MCTSRRYNESQRTSSGSPTSLVLPLPHQSVVDRTVRCLLPAAGARHHRPAACCRAVVPRGNRRQAACRSSCTSMSFCHCIQNSVTSLLLRTQQLILHVLAFSTSSITTPSEFCGWLRTNQVGRAMNNNLTTLRHSVTLSRLANFFCLFPFIGYCIQQTNCIDFKFTTGHKLILTYVI